MSKHTPGPWVISEDDSFDSVPFIPIETDLPTGPSFKFICEVKGNGVESDELGINDEDRANARLIAAAPEMLDALKECLKCELARRADLKTGAPASQYSDARIARVQAAIAKATGAE